MPHFVNEQTRAKQVIRQPLAAGLVCIFLLLSGCVEIGTSTRGRPSRETADYPSYPTSRRVDSWEADRLRRVTIPLIQAMDHPCRLNEVRVGVVDQNEINAANAGNCQFYVTMGLISTRSIFSAALAIRKRSWSIPLAGFGGFPEPEVEDFFPRTRPSMSGSPH